MNILKILVLSFLLSACSSKPPAPPEPKGEFINVNTAHSITMSGLKYDTE